MWNKRTFHSLLIVMQNGVATLEDNLVVSYETKHIPTIHYSNQAPWYLPKEVENLCPHKNLHMNGYSRFIHNCQSLGSTKMSFRRWMDKLCCIQIIEYYSALKRNELSSHENMWRNLKLHTAKWKKLIWKSYTPYDSNYMTFWKSKTGDSKKISSCQGVRGWYRINRAQKIFRAVKILWMIP